MKSQYREFRFDLSELRQSSRTPQGFLKVPGFATRVGVFPYMDASGKIRRELRHPDDVFDPSSLETLKNAPVTVEHPPEMITPENVDEYSVGHTTERVEIQEDKVDTDLIVESQEGIDAVEKEGIRELSCGYAADIIEEPGVFNGAPYDYRQVNIKYNHLAMVKRGRAGPEIRMRLDSAHAVMQDEISVPNREEFSQETTADEDLNAVGDPNTKKIVIAGKEVELPSDAADAMQEYIDRFDEMRAKLAQLEDKMKQGRKDQKDVDINQPGISPQVKVEQQMPDGRAAGAKVPARPGTITGGPAAKGDDDMDEKKGDEDQHGVVGGEKPAARAAGAKALADGEEEKDDQEGMEDADPEMKGDYDAGAGTGAGGAAMGPIDRMKKDLDSIRDAYKGDADLMEKVDALEGKMDAFASESMGKDEKRGDRKDSKKTRTDSEVNVRIRARVKLERTAEKLVPMEVSKRFDSMSDIEIRKAVITHRAPNADLSGKSHVYIEARFDSMCEDLEETGGSEFRREMGKRMLGIEGEDRTDSNNEVDPGAARLRMISSGREEYKTAAFAAQKK